MKFIKMATAFLVCLLFALTVMYPAGVMITACFGYSFELISVSAFALAIAILSVCIVVLDLVCKSSLENKTIQILLALITPLSLINAVFYIFESPQILVIASVFISAGCCCFLTVKHGKPLSLKIVALALSALMILPIGFFGFIMSAFDGMVQNTVVQTVESPSGKYYAQVIDNDQGALGGNTFVEVYKQVGMNFYVFRVNSLPQRLYSGDWGEFENMQIFWKDDNCLIINFVQYEIE